MSGPDRARQDAYTEIYFLLPEGWMVGIPSFEAARGSWSVTARAPEDPGRPGPRPSVTGEGDDGVAALEDLGRRLRKLPEVQRRLNVERRSRPSGGGAMMAHGVWAAVGLALFEGLIKLAERGMRAKRLRALQTRRRRRRQARGETADGQHATPGASKRPDSGSSATPGSNAND